MVYTVGEMAKLLGVTASTLRYYQLNSSLSREIVTNLVTIFFHRSSRLSFHRIELHFIGKSPFTRQQFLTLQIAIHHDDCSGIVIGIANDNRHGFLTCQLGRMMPPVSCDQLIAAVRIRTRNRGDKHAILSHAFHCAQPVLTVKLPCGSQSTSSTFFPSCASPTPRFRQDVVLPTPPFWLQRAVIVVFIFSFPF